MLSPSRGGGDGRGSTVRWERDVASPDSRAVTSRGSFSELDLDRDSDKDISYMHARRASSRGRLSSFDEVEEAVASTVAALFPDQVEAYRGGFQVAAVQNVKSQGDSTGTGVTLQDIREMKNKNGGGKGAVTLPPIKTMKSGESSTGAESVGMGLGMPARPRLGSNTSVRSDK